MKDFVNKVGKILLALGLFFLAKEISQIAIIAYSVVLIAYLFFKNYSGRTRFLVTMFTILFGGVLFFGVENLSFFTGSGVSRSAYFFLRDTYGYSFILAGAFLVSIRRIKNILKGLKEIIS